jgi:hypothetical protein
MTEPVQNPTADGGLQTYPRGMVPRLVNEMRLACIAEMREAVHGISSARDNPDHQGGIRWAQARMLHALDEMEAAVP